MDYQATAPRTQNGPDSQGHYGRYGGINVPEPLKVALRELEATFVQAIAEPAFHAQLDVLHRDYIGRPTALYEAKRLAALAGGARIFLKREDLAHTGAHKINNAIGQALLALRTGKHRVIAETGAGQHGVATATACAMLGLECVIYQGEEDARRQALNVLRMEMLGAEVRRVRTGTRTLTDAVDAAFGDYVESYATTHFLVGSAVGPHPYPMIVREFQSVIGREARAQILAQAGRLPTAVVACIGGGSNAIGVFSGFVADAGVRLIGAEGAGCGIDTDRHAATLTLGRPGLLHGAYTYVIQDEHGNVLPTHSISAGLDYPGVGPEHSNLKDSGRAEYVAVTDDQALEALQLLSRTEGIIPALESAHAIHHAVQLAGQLKPEDIVLVNLSGRGDKDMETVAGFLRERMASGVAPKAPRLAGPMC